MNQSGENKYRNWIKGILAGVEYDSASNYYYILLVSAPILLTIYRCYTEAQNFMVYFPALGNIVNGEVYAYLLEYSSFFVLMLVIPVLMSLFSRRSGVLLSLFSLRGVKKNLLWVLATLAVVVIPSAYYASTLSTVLTEYPLPRVLLQNQQMLPVYFLGLFFLYYLPWEFFFRGFLLFGLKDKYGTPAAVLIQTISSCLVHIGKPTPEVIGSIPFGIIFGVIALRTKNIWIVVLLHAALGIFTDLFIIY